MALWQWSPTAANNANADPTINWAEGQPPSSVNDSARAMMAAIATWFQSAEWLNLGDTATYVSGTRFTVPTDRTSIYTVGRRLRAFVTAGTVYGSVSAAAYTSVTTVTVTWDSGALDSGLSEVDVGILNAANLSIPAPLQLNAPASSGATLTINAANLAAGANIKLIGSGATTPNKYLRAIQGFFQIVNSANNAVCISSDDSGNFTATGNVSANSDRRLKTDIEPIELAIARVKKLNGVTYRRRDIDQDVRQMGLLAQDVQAVAPECVREGPDGYLSVAYGNLIGLLVEAMKEMSVEIEMLKAAK